MLLEQGQIRYPTALSGPPPNTACSRLAGIVAIFRVRMRSTAFQLGSAVPAHRRAADASR
jgi:hypothetical protein